MKLLALGLIVSVCSVLATDLSHKETSITVAENSSLDILLDTTSPTTSLSIQSLLPDPEDIDVEDLDEEGYITEQRVHTHTKCREATVPAPTNLEECLKEREKHRQMIKEKCPHHHHHGECKYLRKLWRHQWKNGCEPNECHVCIYRDAACKKSTEAHAVLKKFLSSRIRRSGSKMSIALYCQVR
ncbi:hypothetical protein F5Y08DRAFT_340071 [Xylaria arbuscula]|nr:hypothetical protein F5Y08DRAFT_340071 [Xylaria arbuscula]